MSTSKDSYHHGNLAAAVLAAARRLLEDAPAERLSVRELAREAGVSHAAPYRHFGDRPGLLLALAEHCFEEFLADQQGAFDSAVAGTRLPAVGEAYVRFGIAHPHVFALIFDPALVRPAEPPAVLGALGERHAELLGAAVQDAAAAGLTPSGADPRDVGAALWSLVHGLTALAGGGSLPTDRIPQILAALLRRAAVR